MLNHYNSLLLQSDMRKLPFFLLILLAACQPKTGSTNEQVPEDKIAKMLAEIALADGAVSPLSGYLRDSLVHVYYNQIYEQSGMTLEEYDKHLHTLAKDTERLERVLHQAEAMLRTYQQQDSIRRSTEPTTPPK